MKPHKIFSVIFISFLLVGFAKAALAFNPAIDCNTPLLDISNPNKVNETTIQTYLTAYTTKGKWNDDEKYYALCFVKDKSFPGKITKSITISTTATDESGKSIPLIVYGLNLAPSNMTAQTLLTLSGSSITLDHATLTGPSTSSGRAIDVTGTNHSILSSTIQKFDTGIQIGTADTEGANVTVKDSNLGTASNVVTTGINLVNAVNLKTEGLTFNIKDGGHNIMPAYTFDIVAKRCEATIKSADGKKDVCDTTKEDNKVIKLAGKPPIEETSCGAGKSVEIYKRPQEGATELVMSCNLFQDVEAKILMGKDEFEIKKGDCAFSCDVPTDKTLRPWNKISLKYKPDAASNATEGLVQLSEDGAYTKVSLLDLPDVSLGGISVIDTTSGADGNNGGTIIIVTGYTEVQPVTGNTQVGGQDNPLVDGAGTGGDPKGQQVPPKEDDGSGQVGQGSSGACGANISTSTATSTHTHIIWLHFFLMLVPVSILFIFKRAISSTR